MTKDTASHFYIDYLPKGVYLNTVRVQHKGQYQSGMANIQRLYASSSTATRQPRAVRELR